MSAQKAPAAHLGRSVAAARRAAEIAVSQYGDGDADYSRVLNTQNTQRGALASEAKLIQAGAVVSENLVSLYKSLGGGREYLPAETIVEMAYRSDWGDLVRVNPARQQSR